jgi:NTP pyrophosphatase (non-canonical NTP hydrolase)
MCDLNPIQQEVHAFIQEFNLEIDPAYRLLDLLSELGETAKEILKSSSYGAGSFTPNEAWEEELGDLCFSLAALAASTGVDLDRATRLVLEKYRARMSGSGAIGSGR